MAVTVSRWSSSSSARASSCFWTRVRCKLLYRSACLSFRHAKNAAFWPSLLHSSFRSKHRDPAMSPRSLLCALISWSSALVMTWACSRSKSTSLIWRWSLRSRIVVAEKFGCHPCISQADYRYRRYQVDRVDGITSVDVRGHSVCTTQQTNHDVRREQW